MKILLVNKFLYPKGGSETYLLSLGRALSEKGHTVRYFGLENEKNVVGNDLGLAVTDMDFSRGVGKNLAAPFRIVYSTEARRKMRRVLDDFQPDAIHFNNIQFHLTPSVILASEAYRRRAGKPVKLVYTAHDYQLICPAHGLFERTGAICEKCLDGRYRHCVAGKCVKGSRAKSLLAAADAFYWKHSRAYDFLDAIVCPSAFLKEKLDTQKRLAAKTVVLHNFIEKATAPAVRKGDYVLEFGHLSRDKGTYTLLEAARRMPETRFVFAGFGEAEAAIRRTPNADFVGFKTGKELRDLIAGALCSVCPSECYENCPYSVIESQLFGTPVIGSRRGGIPELLEEGKTGLLFEAGNADDLEQKLRFLLSSPETLAAFTASCREARFETIDTYLQKLLPLYEAAGSPEEPQ